MRPLDRRLQIAAEAVERGGAEDRDFGLAGNAGDKAGVFANVGGMIVELVGEELLRAARGVGEEASDEAVGIETAGGFSAERDAVKVIGGGDPLVAEVRAMPVGGLQDDARKMFARHLRI